MIIIQTKDHYFIARFISNDVGLGFCPLKRLAFMIGAVFPDVNVLSYFKEGRLNGHTYMCSRSFIGDTINYVQGLDTKNVFDWFKIGMALHYLQDSFTYAHNESFRGGIFKHFEYESRLHEVIRNSYSQVSLKAFENMTDNKQKLICRLYKNYCKKLKYTTKDDTAYIVLSSVLFLKNIIK